MLLDPQEVHDKDDVIPMLTLYQSVVRCKLNYCSQRWSPARKGDIQAIEMVQNSFLWKIPAIRYIILVEIEAIEVVLTGEHHGTMYTIINIWRMLKRQVPCINCLNGGANVKFIWHIRRGSECQIPCINHHSPKEY